MVMLKKGAEVVIRSSGNVDYHYNIAHIKKSSASEMEKTETIPDGNTASVPVGFQSADDNTMTVSVEDVRVLGDSMASVLAGVQFPVAVDPTNSTYSPPHSQRFWSKRKHLQDFVQVINGT